jgi:hypothetical protein
MGMMIAFHYIAGAVQVLGGLIISGVAAWGLIGRGKPQYESLELLYQHFRFSDSARWKLAWAGIICCLLVGVIMILNGIRLLLC